jgi:hypothetical protein
MISANEARELFEADGDVRLQSYIERVYGQGIKEAAERHMSYLTVYERRPREAIEEIVNYLKEYGYRVVAKEVAKPLWSIEVYW